METLDEQRQQNQQIINMLMLLTTRMDAIGFTNSIRKTYNTMNDYINDFNNKVDDFYDCTTKVQLLFDAILDPNSTPFENKPKQSKRQKM